MNIPTKWLKPQIMKPKDIKTVQNNEPIVLGENPSEDIPDVSTRNETMYEEMTRKYFQEFSIGAASAGSVKVTSHLQALSRISVPPTLFTGKTPTYPKGYALTKFQTTTPMSPLEKSFLLEYFNEGQRTKRKMAGAAGAALALEKIRELPTFTPPYPKVGQIQTFFTKCYSAIKNQAINSEGVAVVPTNANLDAETTPEEEMDVRLIETTTEQNEIVSAMEQLEQNDDGSSNTHPLEENYIDLCAIAMDYMTKKGKPGKLHIDDYEKDDIKEVMEKLNIQLPNKMVGRFMARAICKYVSTKCPDQCTSQI